jgi:hypothetical protein
MEEDKRGKGKKSCTAPLKEKMALRVCHPRWVYGEVSLRVFVVPESRIPGAEKEARKLEGSSRIM